jgi:hypothetical protein
MLTGNYYDFTRQAGCTHVVVHLGDYFNQDSSNPRNNQPNGANYIAGNLDQLWTVKELRTRRGEMEDSGLALAVVESLDPAPWRGIVFDGPQPSTTNREGETHHSPRGRDGAYSRLHAGSKGVARISPEVRR